jgi:hypothetical protein
MNPGGAGHGWDMGAFLVPVLLVLVVVVLGVLAVKRFGRDEIEHSDRLQADERPTLSYEVPPGQDPALVLAGLREAGYDASADSEPGPSSPILIIGNHSGGRPDREDLRSVLGRIDGTNVNPDENQRLAPSRVRFTDEV